VKVLLAWMCKNATRRKTGNVLCERKMHDQNLYIVRMCGQKEEKECLLKVGYKTCAMY